MQLNQNLIKITEENKSYHSLNGKSILNFPLTVPVGISIDTFLDDIFEKYKLLISKDLLSIDNYFTNGKISKIGQVVNEVCTNIMNALNNFKKGKINTAYESISKAIEKGKLQKIQLNKNETFFRMRSGLGYKDMNDFYHIPFNKLHLTDSYRFSMSGFPCLYIGYTEDVCKREIRKDGSIIQLKLKDNDNTPLSLIDLTWYEASHNVFDSFLISWPIIASCYIVPNYCKTLNKECTELFYKFKEQYVIPQLVSAYIRENHEINNVDGIRYYTTRHEDLKPQETDYMNIALFANYDQNRLKNEGRIYDENITFNRFVFSNPHDVRIEE